MSEFEAIPQNFEDARLRFEQMPHDDLVAKAIAQEALLRLLMQRQVEAERDSLHDELTGISNRRGLRKAYEKNRTLANRRKTDPGGTPDVMLYIDLDGFKSINDTRGHAAGDETLKTIAHLLDLSVRTEDHVGRLGGDEFLALLSGASLLQGKEVAERMSTHAQTFSGADEHIIIPTFSIGVAQIDYGLDFNAMLDKADRAMYQAKQAGKDQIYILEPSVIQLPD